MKPAIKVIDPFSCPYCGSKFDMEMTIVEGTIIPIEKIKDNGLTYYTVDYDTINTIDPKDIIVWIRCQNHNCNSVFKSEFSNGGVCCIDAERANEIKEEI